MNIPTTSLLRFVVFLIFLAGLDPSLRRRTPAVRGPRDAFRTGDVMVFFFALFLHRDCIDFREFLRKRRCSKVPRHERILRISLRPPLVTLLLYRRTGHHFFICGFVRCRLSNQSIIHISKPLSVCALHKYKSALHPTPFMPPIFPKVWKGRELVALHGRRGTA